MRIVSKKLEFASSGNFVITPTHFNIGEHVVSDSRLLDPLTFRADQFILTGTGLIESDYYPTEEVRIERAIACLRHIDLINALQEHQETATYEHQQLIVGLRDVDIFGYEHDAHVTRSTIRPKSFERNVRDLDCGINNYSFYLRPRSEIQLARWSRRGSVTWWGRYACKYWQMDDLVEYENNGN